MSDDTTVYTLTERMTGAELFGFSIPLGAESVRVYKEEIRDGKRVRFSVEGRAYNWQVVICAPVDEPEEGDDTRIYLPSGDAEMGALEGRMGHLITFQMGRGPGWGEESPDLKQAFQEVLQDAVNLENSGFEFHQWLSETGEQEITPDKLPQLNAQFHEQTRRYEALRVMFGDELHAWLFCTEWE